MVLMGVLHRSLLKDSGGTKHRCMIKKTVALVSSVVPASYYTKRVRLTKRQTPLPKSPQLHQFLLRPWVVSVLFSLQGSPYSRLQSPEQNGAHYEASYSIPKAARGALKGELAAPYFQVGNGGRWFPSESLR
jgi:hypothetical protein